MENIDLNWIKVFIIIFSIAFTCIFLRLKDLSEIKKQYWKQEVTIWDLKKRIITLECKIKKQEK